MPRGVSMGVMLASITLVKLNICNCFTMSILTSSLAFLSSELLLTAKLNVLTASTLAAIIGLTWGKLKSLSQHT